MPRLRKLSLNRFLCDLSTISAINQIFDLEELRIRDCGAKMDHLDQLTKNVNLTTLDLSCSWPESPPKLGDGEWIPLLTIKNLILAGNDTMGMTKLVDLVCKSNHIEFLDVSGLEFERRFIVRLKRAPKLNRVLTKIGEFVRDERGYFTQIVPK
jgi:hypothetical protein